MRSTIDESEIEKFSRIAEQWWDEEGKFKPLHKFNPARISYIKERLVKHFNLDADSKTPLSGLKILDIGCGGGLLCEPLSRLGAEITGIDPSEKNIGVAKLHAKQSSLAIDYQVIDVEELAKAAGSSIDKKYHVVLAMEVVEHVADLDNFITASSQCLTTHQGKSGLMFVATINQTIQSYFKAIIGAEYILRWLEPGTHSWKKFLKPSVVNKIAEANQLELLSLDGFSYNLLRDQWRVTDDLSVNYVITFKGPSGN